MRDIKFSLDQGDGLMSCSEEQHSNGSPPQDGTGDGTPHVALNLLDEILEGCSSHTTQ